MYPKIGSIDTSASIGTELILARSVQYFVSMFYLFFYLFGNEKHKTMKNTGTLLC